MSGERAPLALFEPYLPAVASHPAVSRGEPLTRDAVTLFLDIAGFTGLSERLARQGTAGTEQLGGIVRQVIGGALDIAVGHGGDALAFGGDAITVAFGGDEAGWSQAGRCAADVIALVEATSAALAAPEPAEITVRVGISGGRVTSLVVPGESRHVIVHLGPGLDRAVAAAGRSEPGGLEVAREQLTRSRSSSRARFRRGRRACFIPCWRRGLPGLHRRPTSTAGSPRCSWRCRRPTTVTPAPCGSCRGSWPTPPTP